MTGEEFKKIRLSKGMTQTELATLLGITRMTIFKYEKERVKISGPVELCMTLLESGLI
jgi:DNA-binding XRE family transcriptional regulator